MRLAETPAQDGFHMPGEFEDQAASYMIWPERPDNWREGGKPAQKAFARLAETIAQFEPVTMLVNQDQYNHARASLSPAVRVVEMSSNDSWMKDCGPFYVVNDAGDIRAVDFQFNAWGGLLDGLYFPWDKDNQIGKKVADLQEFPVYEVAAVLEGCAIHVDGQGTLIATESVVLSEGRNPGGLTKADAEKIFHDYLGVTKTIWLPEGYFMDETNGDIDNMLNFVAPGEVVLTWTDDTSDPQAEISEDAYERLAVATDARGRHFKIHKLQTPRVLTLSEAEANGVDPINGMLPRVAGQRLTASYVSYITTNQAILMPIFDDPQDAVAHEQLAALYPTRQVVDVPATEILTGGGNIHTIAAGVPGHHTGGK